MGKYFKCTSCGGSGFAIILGEDGMVKKFDCLNCDSDYELTLKKQEEEKANE